MTKQKNIKDKKGYKCKCGFVRARPLKEGHWCTICYPDTKPSHPLQDKQECICGHLYKSHYLEPDSGCTKCNCLFYEPPPPSSIQERELYPNTQCLIEHPECPVCKYSPTICSAHMHPVEPQPPPNTPVECEHKRFALTDKCVKCNKSVFIAFDTQPPVEEWKNELEEMLLINEHIPNKEKLKERIQNLIDKTITKAEKRMIDEIEKFLSLSMIEADDFGDVTCKFGKKHWIKLKSKITHSSQKE